jgi:glycosyltransferase involved in cell wall biosynthesis
MMPAVFLNGRFLSQPVTGVQRFSMEMASAIDRLVSRDEWPETAILTPPLAGPGGHHCGAVPYRRLGLRNVGRTRGHWWEQTELPAAARGGVLVSLGNTAPLLGGRRQVVVIHDAGVFDTPESYSLRFRTWYKALQRGLIRTGVRIATVSRFSRDRIAARFGLDPELIAVTYEGADHILRVPADTDVLKRHQLRPREFALVVSSRAAHKNLDALREAAAVLARRNMTIAVAGEFYPGVFRRSAGIGFTGCSLGRVTDAELRALYESAACLLFPSRYEGFGLPPVEAMACGCPVLASSGGAVEEICGDTALYFTNGGARAITDAVERLLDEKGLAEALRTGGPARAAALSWEASARKLGAVVRLAR